MAINRDNDTMLLRAKPLLLKSRKQGQQDIIIRNIAEMKTFLTTCKFTRAHMASLMAGLYCPPTHLNAIFTAVAKKINRAILDGNNPKPTWTTAINKKFHPLILKLATLYFMNQKLTIPRCCTAFTPLDQTSYWLVGFTDGSLEYSAACIYLISASKANSDCKVQLITTATKILNHKIATITSIMLELAIPISKCILFCDAISTIISQNNHPANYTHPISRWLATANIQLYKIAKMIECAKEGIVLYINQKKTSKLC